MCTCFSGRCALSNYVTNRDANRGGCAQVCRFSFSNPSHPDFTMALKDLNMAIYIKDLIEIGVSSFKVEGRMRSLYYLATVIGTYREIIDAYYDNSLEEDKIKECLKRLERVSNRENSTHYFMKEADYTDQYFSGRSEVSNQDYLGQVISYQDGYLKMYERNYFEVGNKVCLFTPSGDREEFLVEELFDEDMNRVDVARHPDQIYYIKHDFSFPVVEYSMLMIVDK